MSDAEACCLCSHHCQVNKKLEEVLTSKNGIIRSLQYDVAKVRVCRVC
jgi:hypothetical protein